jgi:tetratricopeptide (TPR) repeat protein
MNTLIRKRWAMLLFLSLLPLSVAARCAQSSSAQTLPSVSGTIYDPENHPLSAVKVTLENGDPAKTLQSATDAQGHFQFAALPPGSYRLRTKRDGYHQASQGPFVIHAQEAKQVVLHLARIEPSTPSKDDPSAIPFSDEPQFTVAGVTDTSALGVHSSSRNMPNSSALTKDTVALAGEGTTTGGSATPPAKDRAASEEASLRAKLATNENADLRFQLAELEEREGRPVEAEKDYQRAAELAPSELHFFSWGAELLLHRAFEPATEVFRAGRARYPQSVRLLLGLGASYYGEGAREEAAQSFLQAIDLDATDARPYLFLGRLLSAENASPAVWTDKMKQFPTLQPQNAMAHYLYGLALAKEVGGENNRPAAESQFRKAIELDPHFGNAYLQLGILLSERKHFAGAIDALQKAIGYTPVPDEAHYRLAEVYRRMGDTEKARQETALYKQTSEQKAHEEERQRHEIQQFVYTLKDSTSPAQGQNSTPNPQ